MHTVSVAKAKAHLSEILAEVETGEEVIITRRGVPVAKLSAVKKPRQPIDFTKIDALRAILPKATRSSAELIREMRDEKY